MKKLVYIIFACFAVVLSSCSEYGEEIWINADGSGRYEMTQDFSDMLPLLEMGLASAQEKAEENEDADGGMNMGKLLTLFESGKVDTLISMETFMKESLEKKDGRSYTTEEVKAKMITLITEDEEFKGTAEEKKKITKILSEVLKMSTRIQYNQKYSSLKNTLYQSFDDTEDMFFGNIPEMAEIMAKYSDEGGDKLNDPKAKEAMDKMKDSFASYELSKNTLKVKRKAMEMDSEDPESVQQMDMIKGMMGNSTYTMKIHVPGKVKKVSQVGAKFEGSTVTWTIPALDMYDTTKDLNLDIKFKPKKGIVYEN